MMSEKIVIARHRHICELCDQPIRPGERCHLIRDDINPKLVWFEHVRCPNTLIRRHASPPPKYIETKLAITY